MRIGVPKEVTAGPGTIGNNPGLRGGHRGQVTHPAIAASLGFVSKPPEAAFAA